MDYYQDNNIESGFHSEKRKLLLYHLNYKERGEKMTESTIELIKKAKNGNQDAITVLIKKNSGLIASVAKKYIGHGVDFDDLMQEGSLGFIRGIKEFNLESGFELSTYVRWWIMQGCGRCVANEGHLVRIPVYIHEQNLKINKFTMTFEKENGYEPSLEDYLRSGFTQKNVLDAENTRNNIEKAISLDSTLPGLDDDATFETAIEDESGLIEDLYFEKEKSCQLHEIIQNKLTSNEADIICRYYGMDSYDRHSLEQIGEIYHLTRERIRQIKAKGLNKLKKEMLKPKYQDFFVS